MVVQRHVVRIYLTCSVREQALRYVDRIGGAAIAAAVRTGLPPNKQYSSLKEVAKDISALVSGGGGVGVRFARADGGCLGFGGG